MRFCFFSLNRLAFVGGAEKYILNVSCELKNLGHEVYYLGDCRPILAINVLVSLFTGLSSPFKVIKEIRQLKNLPSFPPESTKYLTPLNLSLKSLFPMTKERAEALNILKGCQNVFVKNEFLDMVFFAFLKRFNPEIKSSLLAFSAFNYQTSSWRGKLHNLFYQSYLYSLLLSQYRYIIVSNRADSEILSKKYGIPPERIVYIPYGLNDGDFLSAKSKEDNGLFNILFVGRLEEQKGVDILVEIIKRLASGTTSRRVQFTIIGDGPWRDQIVNLTKEFSQLHYLGELSRDYVIKEYFKHDLLLVPSRWETFSYVTLEAQFSGLPVVAFDIPGPQDIIENGKTGQLVPLGDITEFTKTIKNYCQKSVNLEERNYISQRARATFSIESTVNHLSSLN